MRRVFKQGLNHKQTHIEHPKQEKIQMKNKIEKKENNSLGLPNYEPLRYELSKILENQRISKKKQDQI